MMRRTRSRVMSASRSRIFSSSAGSVTSTSGNNRTGWKNSRYDALIKEANLQTDLQKRAENFRRAETILITDEPPIVPLYFYAGFNYFDPQKIGGIWQNILDEHPMQYIYKVGPCEGGEARALRGK